MYKKNTAFRCGRTHYILTKILLIMKLSFILLFLAIIQVRASSFAQKITIQVKEKNFEDFLMDIQQQSGYDFIYSAKLAKHAKPVTFSCRNADIEEVLKKSLFNQPFTYVVRGRAVTLIEKQQTVQYDQQAQVAGKVTDENNQPLPGVTVHVKNSSETTATNAEGNYKITAGANAVLIFRFIGFAEQEIATQGRSTINVSMRPDIKGLNEVVVVGYGTQKKVNLTGAVSSVSGADLALRPAGQTSAALQGVASGVTVIQGSGRPGGDNASIRIRGVGTISTADPLVLIDGVEGSINNIDPNIIESVSILKDAASSSIYGSRAANGVILVTTKRGTGDKISLGYNNYVGWQKETNTPDIVNALDHMLLLNEAYVNAGSTPIYADTLIESYRRRNGVSSDRYPNTDWQKETLTGSGLQQSHFLTVNGGTSKIRMLASFGYLDQAGIIENSSFRRYTVRSNADILFSEKFTARIDLQYVNAITTEPGAGSGEIFQWINGIPANQIAINENGTWGVGWNGFNPVSGTRDGGTNRTKGPFGSINAVINYKPFKWLNAEVAYAPKYAESLTKNFRKAVQSYLPNGTPSYLAPSKSTLTQGSSQSVYNNMRATLTASQNFGSHSFKLLAGMSREDYSTDYMTAYRDTYVLPDYPVLDAGSAATQTASGKGDEWALQSFFGRFNYNYKEKYLLELNGRYDGSSRFMKGNRYGFFPSVSAGWRISEEEFMREIRTVIANAKIRASWGKLGNQQIAGTDYYPYISSYTLGSYTLGGAAGTIVNTATLTTLANKTIAWESTEEKNIGLDLNLFSKLDVTADLYHRRTTGILLKLDIPLIVGLGAPPQNAGIVENKGWELGLGYSGQVRDLKYRIGFNVSDVKNEVVDLRGKNQTGLTVHREGHPAYSIFGYQADGFFQSDEEVASHATQFGTVKAGDIRYIDQNGDNIINEADKVVIGSTIPRYTFGSNINASWKGFDINLQIQGVGKADGYLYGPGIMPFNVGGAIGGTIREDNKDHWTPDNRDASFPRLAFGATNNEQASSFWLKDASYIRLKNFQVGYTLPSTMSGKIKVKRLRLFANGSNLFSIDNFWNGYDVEAPVGQGNYYPQVKVYSFGLEANF
ncbi:TonB-linked SusC/RagA family outer membrane protein [Arcticibacter tournemirensis]|uniref:TonB-dependent receptor n=2 Tax=Arcticibacter tournemirensis TaxID=699437 RepID=A0A5M9GZG4_9SPHI|nr:TonB-dependent receptor [Arcticibacter tournemirensis]TQM50262.1 TonB-linked SusC/RagA family outer membrane protein [Arcticibacter tournemirensis]